MLCVVQGCFARQVGHPAGSKQSIAERAQSLSCILAAWQRAGRSVEADDQFLISTALNYERGLSCWNVGSVMQKYLHSSGMRWADVAYFNVAKCQAMDAGSKLQDLCIKKWPIERLVLALRLSAIVTCSIKIRDRGLKGTPVYWYHQRNQLDTSGRPKDIWMADLVANKKN